MLSLKKKLVSKLAKIRKTLLVLFLSSNLLLVSTGSAELNLATPSAEPVNQVTDSSTLTSPQPGEGANGLDILAVRDLPPSTRIDTTRTFFEDEIVVIFKEAITEEAQRQILLPHNMMVVRKSKRTKRMLLRVDPVQRDQVISTLKQDPNVEYAGLNYLGVFQGGEGMVGGAGGGGFGTGPGPSCSPNDVYFCNNSQWGLKDISAPAGWGLQRGSSSIVVAVLDTGIDWNHYDLKIALPTPNANGGRVVRGLDLTRALNFSNSSMDDVGHGTKVAGIIGAITNNGSAIAGVDWYAKLVSIKTGWYCATFPDKGCTSSYHIADGIEEAVNPSPITLQEFNYQTYYAPRANVINISAAAALDTPELRSAVSWALSQGVYIVASVDNSNQGFTNCFMRYPAAYPGVISVAGTDINHQHYTGCTGNVDGSKVWQRIQITAPGKDILTLLRQSGVGNVIGGTSFAAAFVSGVMSILVSCSATPYIDLIGGAWDYGFQGWDTSYGYGVVHLSGSLVRNQSCY